MIVGLGETGMSCARYFKRHGIPFSVVDGNPSPPNLAALRSLAPGVDIGPIDADALKQSDTIVVSPGVPLSTPEIQAALEAGVTVTGDVAIFAEEVTVPFVAITGSNGKSTVTSLVGKMARDQNIAVSVGGNIGTPCLDLVDDESELYVLELSSYQLETANPLYCEVAVVLNLSPDHLDRYPSQQAYYQTKANIYNAARKAVVNRDLNFDFNVSKAESVITIGSDVSPDKQGFGLIRQQDQTWLARGDKLLLNAKDLGIKGTHNQVNALAALAIGVHLQLDMAAMLESLKTYKGLEHRCELLGVHGKVTYFNDSKSTNIASTEAAITGLATKENKNIILILGGIDKGANFQDLVPAITQHVKQVVVYGRDVENIASVIEQCAATRRCADLAEVVDCVVDEAQAGDVVLFSPACSSFDMFENFEHRGRVFKALLMEKSGEALS